MMMTTPTVQMFIQTRTEVVTAAAAVSVNSRLSLATRVFQVPPLKSNDVRQVALMYSQASPSILHPYPNHELVVLGYE